MIYMFPVIDLHCDTMSGICGSYKSENRTGLRENGWHIDLQKMKKAGYMCQCFAMFIHIDSCKAKGMTPKEYCIEMNDVWDSEILNNSDLIRPALSYSDIVSNYEKGLLSALKTVEEGAVYEGDPDNLKFFYDRGVRMSTLTWNYENELAFPNMLAWELEDGSEHNSIDEPIPQYGTPGIRNMRSAPDTSRKLKEAGREIVKCMEETGIVIDVSHLNDAGIYDILDIVSSGTPVIASHSNVRAEAGHARNLSDDMLKRIAGHGGVAGINFCADFLNDRHDNISSVDDMIRHMKHMKAVAGIDVIALGSDFDGIASKVELENCGNMQTLADRMSSAGFTDDEISKVFSGNALRVFKEVLG